MTDKSPEGTQFYKGFGGFGGFLRYKVDLEVQESEFIQEDSDEDFIWSQCPLYCWNIKNNNDVYKITNYHN